MPERGDDDLRFHCLSQPPKLRFMASAPFAAVVHIEYPDWVDSVVDWSKPYGTDEDRMRVAIRVARANVEHGSGGPFGAAIFESNSGRLVAVGMNSVVRLNN